MKRYGVVAALLCFLCIAALQPAQAWQVLTISNLEHLSNDGSGQWQPQSFDSWCQVDGNYHGSCITSFSQDWGEAYVDCDTTFGPGQGRLSSIYTLFPLTPGGWNEPNTTPIRFDWLIRSAITPVYLAVYAGVDNWDDTAQKMNRSETLIWRSSRVCSFTPVSGVFQTNQSTPQFFRIELTTTPVPEPAGMVVILYGLGALRLRRRR